MLTSPFNVPPCSTNAFLSSFIAFNSYIFVLTFPNLYVNSPETSAFSNLVSALTNDCNLCVLSLKLLLLYTTPNLYLISSYLPYPIPDNRIVSSFMKSNPVSLYAFCACSLTISLISILSIL